MCSILSAEENKAELTVPNQRGNDCTSKHETARARGSGPFSFLNARIFMGLNDIDRCTETEWPLSYWCASICLPTTRPSAALFAASDNNVRRVAVYSCAMMRVTHSFAKEWL
jgi:hypothetical protein